MEIPSLRVCFFGKIRQRIMISDHSDHGASKEPDESLSRVDSSVPLMRHDPNDLRSQIRFRILPKKRTQNKVIVSYRIKQHTRTKNSEEYPQARGNVK